MREFCFLIVFLCLSYSSGFESDEKSSRQGNKVLPHDISAESRIVGGWEATDDQFPFHVFLRMVGTTGNQGNCGGSLIHHRWVLTAAHCVANRLTFVVRFGSANYTRPLWMTETDRKYMAPGYIEEDSSVQTHDLGLLGLEHHVVYGDFVKPVRLQSSAQKNCDYEGQVFTANGYGLTDDTANGGLSSMVLRWVHLRGITEEECLEWYPGGVDEYTLCAKYYNDTSQSTCNGDSGGALTMVDSDGILTQVGVVSFRSPLGCNSPSPTGYVKPGHYHEWLTEVTGINFDWNYGDDPVAETPYPGVEHPNHSMQGGTPAPLGTIPSMLHVVATFYSDYSIFKRCAASYIGSHWALTSAGCLEDLRFLYVKAGVSFSPNTELVISTGWFFQHTNWTSSTWANDIGVINLNDHPHFTVNRQPIAIGVGNYILPSSGYFCGWGATEENTYADELYCVNVTLVEQEDGTIIGYSTQGKATEFDVGAPLISNGILIGVVSRWPGDNDDFAAVFSQPRLMIDWISSQSGMIFPETPDVGGGAEEIPIEPEEVTDGAAQHIGPVTFVIASVFGVLLNLLWQ